MYGLNHRHVRMPPDWPDLGDEPAGCEFGDNMVVFLFPAHEYLPLGFAVPGIFIRRRSGPASPGFGGQPGSKARLILAQGNMVNAFTLANQTPIGAFRFVPEKQARIPR